MFLQKLSRHLKKISTATNEIAIDIGESIPIVLRIKYASKFELIYSTYHTMLYKIYYTDNTECKVLHVKWNKYMSAVRDTSDIAASLVKTIVDVPIYEDQDIFKHGCYYVFTGVRTYIDGVPLSNIIHTLENNDVDAIIDQLENITTKIAAITSTHFGHIRDRNLKTTSPIGYLRNRIREAKFENIISQDECIEMECKDYITVPTLRHGNLLPEHVLINNNKIVGIVGWGNADFVPNIYDKLNYFFKINPQDSSCWYAKIFNMYLGDFECNTEFAMSVSRYMYCINRSDVSDRHMENINVLLGISEKIYLSQLSSQVYSTNNSSQDSLWKWFESTGYITDSKM
jgi:hypothetical protein